MIPSRSILITVFITLFLPLYLHASPLTRGINNICLVITYNVPSYSNMASLKTRYKGLFAHVVFYGPSAYPEVNKVDVTNGETSYVAIADAMQRYPNYDGYLLIYNYRYLTNTSFQNSFNTQKIWLDNFNAVPQNLNALTASPWWQNTKGLIAAQKVVNALPTLSAANLAANCAQNIPVSAASMIYFPARIKDQVKQLSDLCYQNKLYNAVAYPLIANCIDSRENMEFFGTSVPWR